MFPLCPFAGFAQENCRENLFENYFKMLLTNLITHDNIYKVRESDQMKQAAVAQSVERRIGSAEVTGPIPVSSWFRKWQEP